MSVCVQLVCYFTWPVCSGKLLPACNVLTDCRLPGPLANESHAPLQVAGGAPFLPRFTDSPGCRDNPTLHTDGKQQKGMPFTRHCSALEIKHTIIPFDSKYRSLKFGRFASWNWGSGLQSPSPTATHLTSSDGGSCHSLCVPRMTSMNSTPLEHTK